jgi:hypothetical protein
MLAPTPPSVAPQVSAEKCNFLDAAKDHRGKSEPLFILYRVGCGVWAGGGGMPVPTALGGAKPGRGEAWPCPCCGQCLSPGPASCDAPSPRVPGAGSYHAPHLPRFALRMGKSRRASRAPTRRRSTSRSWPLHPPTRTWTTWRCAGPLKARPRMRTQHACAGRGLVSCSWRMGP